MAVPAQRLRGRVKWFNVNSGFGFIDCKGENIFVRYTEVGPPGPSFLHEGEDVDFTVFLGPEGLQASEVRRIA